jgi:histidyl-tRNA synthetase
MRWLDQPEAVTEESTRPAPSGTAHAPLAVSAAVPSDAKSTRRERLCADCQRRLMENPLRVFDCKVPADRSLLQDAPTMLDHLCEACRGHFAAVQEHLRRLEIPFRIDPRLVRGLDYYVRTAFEVIAEEGLGAQNSLMGGGRYDGLVKELGGPDVPGFGWALGVERLLMLKEAAAATRRTPGAAVDPDGSPPRGADLFIAHMGEDAWARAVLLAKGLRRHGYAVRLDPARGKLGSQLKRADREGARFTLILGDDEIRESIYQLKNMTTQAQESVEAGPQDDFADRLAARIGPPLRGWPDGRQAC